MPKAYTYEPGEIGFPNGFPSGTLRLNGFEPTRDPAQADIFIIPPSLMHEPLKNPNTFRNTFPHMAGNEERHVAFDVSDFEQIYHMKCLFIRCNLRTWMRSADPNSISWAWPVEDFRECIELPEGGFKYDVSFHAWYKSHATREICMNSCLQNPELKKDIAGYTDFTGYIYYEPEGIRRRKEFRRSMKESRISLCPQSITGVFPYRFFEAMSAGRVAALFCDEFVWPFEEEIPWDQVCFRYPASKAGEAGPIILDLVKNHSDQELIDMGLKARAYWQKFLDRELWMDTMSYSVLKRIKEMGLRRNP